MLCPCFKTAYSPIRRTFSSRRAKRAGWPEGLKGPEGTFRPFGPAGALRRRLLHRNGTFVPPAPSTRTRWQVKTDFRQKTGRSRAVYELIRKIPRGETTEISVPLQALIRFFPSMARNGPFRPFFGPQGAKMEKSLFATHLEGATRRLSRVHPREK